MPQLIIKIKDKIAKPLNNCVICDNSDYTVKFIFDEEWEKEPLRIARFIWNKQYVDVQFTGDTCEVPVISKTNNLAIGVYAGDLRTTTPAILTCYTSILSEDVIEHSVTPSEYEEIMKLLNAQATDIAALKAVDKSIWTNLDTINRTASTAKIKAEEGVAKADSALARNIFTDEEKAKLANITNPMVIKGRVDTVNDLPTEAVIGWFYFVGLESASSYEEYCYSENGWEYIGLSKEGVDLSNYYTKKQVDTTINELKAVDNSLGTRIDNVDSKASAAKIKAEEGVAKADNALTKASSNTTSINSLQTDVNSLTTDVNALKATDERIWTNLDTINKTASTAKVKAEEGVAKADDALAATRTNATNITNLQTDVTDLINEKNIMGSRLTTAENTLNNVKTTAETAETKADDALTATETNANKIKALETNVKALDATDKSIWTNLDTINRTASTAKTKAEEGVAKADDALTTTRTNADNISTHETRLDSIDNTLSSHDTRITTAQQKANSVDEKVDATNKVVGQLSTSLQSAYNKINAHANDIAINRTTLGTQCKNLLKNTAVTKTVNGVTFTVNSDGTITANGTATSRIIFLVGTVYISQTRNYTYTGTPSGGASSTYSMNYRNSNVYKTAETGNGITAQFEGGKTYEAVIDIRSGVTISNLTFYPMLRDADIIDDTYEPYKENVNKRLIKNKSNIVLNKSTLGYQRKNLLKNTAVTKTVNGVTFTVNSDGSITATQTTTSTGNATIKVATMTLKPGTYILTGDDEIRLPGFGAIRFYVGNTIYSSNKPHTFDTEVTINVSLFVWQGVNINGSKTIYPMLRYADITDDTYEPYKESVDERLIKNKSDIAVNKSTLGYQRKNLLKPTSSKTRAGITYTVNQDGSVALTGTSTTGSSYNYFSIPITLQPGKYKVNGMPETSETNTYRVDLRAKESGGTAYGYGAKEFEVEFTETTTVYYMIRIDGSYKNPLDGVIFYPMIRYADILDDTYEPYQPSLVERCLLKDTAGINLGHVQSSSITIDNLSAYTALWVNVSGGVSGINFATNLIVPVAYLAKSTSNRVSLAGGIPSSAYTTSEGPVAAKYMDGTITAKISGNTLDLTISNGTIGSIEVISLM